jgi:SAM-dependent methyltransferase
MDATGWDARYASRDLIWGAAPNRWVTEIVTGLTPGTALDLACGEGRNAIWLAAAGWTVTGVDFSAVALERAADSARHAAPLSGSVTWRRGDLTTDHPDPVSSDLVLLAYLQLPAEQRRIALRAAAAAVRPDGHLLVVAHHSDNLVDGTGGPRDPDVLYTAEDALADVAGVAEFTVLRAERAERPVDGAPRPALDTVLLLRRG